MFVNGAGELDQKHDQDLRDTCVMLLDRAGCDLLTICDITVHSYRSGQTIVKHYRARNADRADAGIDRSNCSAQGRDEGLSVDGPGFGAVGVIPQPRHQLKHLSWSSNLG
jgi:hypothetical protein